MRDARRTAWVALAALAAPLALIGCSKSSDSSSSSESTESSSTSSSTPAPVNTGPVIDTTEFSFTPSINNVKVGEAVTWQNNGSSRHTITAGTEANPVPPEQSPFQSTTITPGQTFVATFNAPGEYQYFCSIHPSRMQGTIIVS